MQNDRHNPHPHPTLALDVPAGCSYRITVNGRLAAEGDGVGDVVGRDGLALEIDRARVLENLPRVVSSFVQEIRRAGTLPDDDGQTAAAKLRDYCEGLAAGSAGLLSPYPTSDGNTANFPGIRPAGSQSYHRGYDWGETFRRFLGALDEINQRAKAAAAGRD